MQKYIVLTILFLFILYLLNNIYGFIELFEEEKSDKPRRDRKSLGGRKR